jgi:hypothetical protein
MNLFDELSSVWLWMKISFKRSSLSYEIFPHRPKNQDTAPGHLVDDVM